MRADARVVQDTPESVWGILIRVPLVESEGATGVRDVVVGQRILDRAGLFWFTSFARYVTSRWIMSPFT